MKRLVRILFSLLLMLTVLITSVGCVTENDKSEGKESDSKGTSTTTEEKKTSTGDEKLTIGVLFDFLSVESRVRQKNELERYAKEKGVEIVFQSANGDEKLQLQQAENLITQKVDALVILAHNADASKPIAQQCKEAGIPFIVTDRLIDDVDIDYFVGVDNDAIGHMQIDFALSKATKGKWVLLAGAPTDPNALLWHNIWKEKLKPYVDRGDIEIVLDEKCDNWDPNVALRHMENVLTSQKDQIDVAMVMNDGLGTGVNQALEAVGMAGKVLMTGLDGEMVAFQRIAEGKQSMTILMDDINIARALIDTAVSAAKGEEVKTNGTVNNGYEDVPAVLIDLILVGKDNLPDIIKMGYGTVEEVYANVPKDQWPEI